jgi:hypothetical protein
MKINRKEIPLQLKAKKHWFDSRDVFVMSTIHNTSAVEVLKGPKGSKEKKPLPCPFSIAQYNQFIGGVDLTDQHLSYYKEER